MDANILNIITTGILAGAAILAYVVQRARYLREIEPDLELKWPEVIRVVRMSSNLKEGWAFYIDIEVENRSKNHAEDLRYEVDLQIFPQRGKPQFIGGKIREYGGLHSAEILAGRKTIIPVYVGSNIAMDFWEPLDSWNDYNDYLDVKKVGFGATISVSYFGKREPVLWFLVPWSFGRLKYVREIFGAWLLEIDDKAKQTYRARYWEHPFLAKDILQSVTSGKNRW